MTTRSWTIAVPLAGLCSGLVAGGLMLVPGAAEAAAPPCTSSDLSVTFKVTDAGMSHVFGKLRFTNTSTRNCRTGGYGGLSYVGHGDGAQVGAAASRAPGTPVRSFVLKPRQRAISKISMTSTAPYPKKTCRPTKVDGFRVYVPNSHTSRFVAYATRACANTSLDQLTHQALKKKF